MRLKTALGLSGLVTSYFFSPLAYAQSLQEAIQYTLNNNPNILSAKSEKNAVTEQIGQARSGYLPTVDLTMGYGIEKSRNPTLASRGTGSKDLDRSEISIQLRQMLFDGFATPSEVDRQIARADSRAYTVFGQSEIIALEAAEAYLNVLRRNKLLELAEENLTKHQSTNDQIVLRAKRGIGRRADADQSAGRLSLAESNYISETGNQQDTETRFLRVIGVLPIQLNTPDTPKNSLPTSLDDAIEKAINNHPVLKSANADINSAFAQYETAKSPFYPRIDLEIGKTYNNNLDGITGQNEDLTAMIKLRYNLFKGGKDIYRHRETAYLINQAKDIRDNTYRQVVESMRFSWTAYRTVSSQVNFLKGHMDSSIKTQIAYTKQFNIGQRTLLDLLDSANEMYLASAAYTNARYDMLYAQYRIFASMGELNSYLETNLAEEAEPLSDPRDTDMTWPTKLLNNESMRLNLY